MNQVVQIPEVVQRVRESTQMEVGVECSDLSSSSDHWFPFMKEHQVRSKGSFRKFLEGLVQQRGQEHIPEVSGVTDDSFRSSREIVP